MARTSCEVGKQVDLSTNDHKVNGSTPATVKMSQ